MARATVSIGTPTPASGTSSRPKAERVPNASDRVVEPASMAEFWAGVFWLMPLVWRNGGGVARGPYRGSRPSAAASGRAVVARAAITRKMRPVPS